MRRLILGLAVLIGSVSQVNAQVETWDLTAGFGGAGPGTLVGGATTNIGFLTGVTAGHTVMNQAGFPQRSTLMVTINDLVANTAGGDADDLRISLHHGQGVTNPGDDPFLAGGVGGAQNPGDVWLYLANEAVVNGNGSAAAGTVGDNLDVTFNQSELKFQDGSITFAGPQTTTHGDGEISFRPQGANNSGGAVSDHNGGNANENPFGDTFLGLAADAPWYVSVTNTGTSDITFTGIRFQGAAINAVPEPASLSLFGIAVFGLGMRRRRREAIV